MPRLVPQDLAFAVVACNNLRDVPAEVPQRLAAEVEARGVAAFKPHELVDIARVLSQLRCLPPGLISQLKGLEEVRQLNTCPLSFRGASACFNVANSVFYT